MSLKDLTTPTFISVLDGWLSPDRQRGLIESLVRSSTLLPDLEASREGLGSSHAADAKAPPALAKAQQKCAALDTAHDRKARGLDKVLDGLSELTDDEDLAAALQEARSEVLGPAGAAVVRWSYTDEAVNAHLADERISPATKALLADVKAGDRTAARWMKDWQSVAQKLGDAETERAAIEAAPAKGQTPADAVRARNATIRVINAFRSMLDLDQADDETRAAILGPLDAALAKAARRGKGAKAGEEPVEPAAPAKPVG